MRSRSAGLGFVLLLIAASCYGGPVGYLQTNLVSNGAVPASVVDPALKNPWGMAFGATPFWVADNGSGLATLYAGNGTKQGLVVTIPPAPGSSAGTLGTPTGTVFNPNSNAPPGSNFNGDRFLFATEDGTISGWQPSLGTTAAVRIDKSAAGAVYRGLTLAGSNIYAADFHGNRIDAFDASYSPLGLPGTFTDPNLPSGYAPFNIQNIGGTLYVLYAKNDGGDEEQAGPGFGFVDRFDTNGNLLQRLIVGDPGNPNSPLNAPWGLALAPATFGELNSLLLVGNFGNGRINAFDPSTGIFVSTLNGPNGAPITIDGLW